jgi:site-specific recombinase XerD
MALDKGMPLEQVQKLLGHEEIGTTLIYANVKEANVKKTYRKLFDKDKETQEVS